MSKKSEKSNDEYTKQKKVHKKVQKIKQLQAERISLDSGRCSSQTLRSKEVFNR